MKCESCDAEATVHDTVIRDRRCVERHLCEACAAHRGVSGNDTQPEAAPPAPDSAGAAPKVDNPGGSRPAPRPAHADHTSTERGSTDPDATIVGPTSSPSLTGGPAAGGALSGATAGTTGEPTGGATDGGAPALKGSAASACPRCGLTFGQFRQSGLMGCPACYDAFEGPLGPLLQRAHEGGTHHSGKIPRGLIQRLGEAALDSADDAATPRGSGSGSDSGSGSARSTSVEERAREFERLVTQLQRQLHDALGREDYERAATLRDRLRELMSVKDNAGAPIQTDRSSGVIGDAGGRASGGAQ
jgi:protein-arginine kinase activator protein McsA